MKHLLLILLLASPAYATTIDEAINESETCVANKLATAQEMQRLWNRCALNPDECMTFKAYAQEDHVGADQCTKAGTDMVNLATDDLTQEQVLRMRVLQQRLDAATELDQNLMASGRAHIEAIE